MNYPQWFGGNSLGISRWDQLRCSRIIWTNQIKYRIIKSAQISLRNAQCQQWEQKRSGCWDSLAENFLTWFGWPNACRRKWRRKWKKLRNDYQLKNWSFRMRLQITLSFVWTGWNAFCPAGLSTCGICCWPRHTKMTRCVYDTRLWPTFCDCQTNLRLLLEV